MTLKRIIAITCCASAMLAMPAGAQASLTQIAEFPGRQPDALSMDAYVAPASSGGVWVSDAGTNRALRFEDGLRDVVTLGNPGDGHWYRGIVEAGGLFYAVDYVHGAIDVLGADGRRLSTFGQNELTDPSRIAFDGQSLFVVDNTGVDVPERTIDQFALGGGFVKSMGEFGSLKGTSPDSVAGVAVAGGRVYVLDPKQSSEPRRFVSVYDADGRRLSSGFGGSVADPTAIGSGPDGGVYIASDQRVAKFSAAGVEIGTWALDPSIGTDPKGISVSASGDINVIFARRIVNRPWAVDKHLQVVDPATGSVERFGHSVGTEPHELVAPTDVAAGPDERVYVVDPQAGRVQILDRDGAFQGELAGLSEEAANAEVRRVDVGSSGRIAGVMSDFLHKRSVRLLAPDGSLVREWPVPSGVGTGDIEMEASGTLLMGISYDSELKASIKRLTEEGDVVQSIPVGDSATFTTDADGTILVAEAGAVRRLSPAGLTLGSWPTKVGAGLGEFERARDIEVAPNGDILLHVQDEALPTLDGAHRIERYSSDGRLIESWETPTPDPINGFAMVGSDRAVLVGERGSEDRTFVLDAAPPRNLVVTSSGDQDRGQCGSDCTLREAIEAANESSGTDRITFAATATVVRPEDELPALTEPVVVDGGPGVAGVPTARIDGSDAGDAVGLRVQGGASSVRGVSVTGFAGGGIDVAGGAKNTIGGNTIAGNGGYGLRLGPGADATLVGARAAGGPNTIGSNDGHGLLVESNRNRLRNNWIGTDQGGGDLGNAGDGVRFAAGEGSVIGKEGIIPTRPVEGGGEIANNTGAGIRFADGASIVRATPIHDNDGGPIVNEAHDLKAPILTGAVTHQGSTTVSGFDESYIVRDYFVAASCGDDGVGDPVRYLGSDDTKEGSDDEWRTRFVPGEPLAPGTHVVAVTTAKFGTYGPLPYGSTSVSNCIRVSPTPTIAVEHVTVDEGEEVLVGVTLSAPAARPTDVQVIVRGAGSLTAGYWNGDLVANASRVTFNPGDTRRAIRVLTNPDQTHEREEVYPVEAAPDRENQQAVAGNEGSVTLIDDDPRPTVQVMASGGGYDEESARRFRIQLTGHADFEIPVTYSTSNGTAVAPQDYEQTNGTVVFSPYATEREVWVQVVDDELPEPEERFVFSIQPPSGFTASPSQATGVIAASDGYRPPDPPPADPGSTGSGSGTAQTVQPPSGAPAPAAKGSKGSKGKKRKRCNPRSRKRCGGA